MWTKYHFDTYTDWEVQFSSMRRPKSSIFIDVLAIEALYRLETRKMYIAGQLSPSNPLFCDRLGRV